MNLETPPVEKEPTATELLKKTFSETRIRTEAEFNKGTMNSWLACLLTDFFVAQLTFSELKRAGNVDESNFKAIQQKLDGLTEYVRTLKGAYPTKEDVPPANVKEELFSLFEKIGSEMIACIKE